MSINTYCLADFPCQIIFAEGQKNDASLISSFEPFRVNSVASTTDLLFTLYVDDDIEPFSDADKEMEKSVENSNGDIIVSQTKDGSYQFIIKNIRRKNCCLLLSDATFSTCKCALRGGPRMRTYGLNNALMIIFAFSACKEKTLLLHASTVRKDGIAYAFTAKSGTGKSTHVAQWMANLPNCDIINDDNPIIRLAPQPYIYGSPWSGKTPCYRNTKAPLGAIVKISRAKKNSIQPSSPVDSFITLLSACATMKWDSNLYNAICSTVTAFVEATPMFFLHCRPDKQAALICFNALRPKEK